MQNIRCVDMAPTHQPTQTPSPCANCQGVLQISRHTNPSPHLLSSDTPVGACDARSSTPQNKRQLTIGLAAGANASTLKSTDDAAKTAIRICLVNMMLWYCILFCRVIALYGDCFAVMITKLCCDGWISVE